MAQSVDIGALIRGARSAARLTQAQVGSMCGYSASAISRIEANKLRLGYAQMLCLAEALNIPLERLRAAGGSHSLMVATVSSGCPSDEEDVVRRREMLSGAIAAGTSAIVGTGTASASETRGPELEDTLFRLPSAQPAPLARLTAQTAAARRAFRAARYDDLSRALPRLLATADATAGTTTGKARQQALAVLARAYVLAAELAAKQHSDAAWVAADRALTAARSSGLPVPVGEASRVLAITMRRSGRWSSAVHLLTQEATALDAAEERSTAVRTTLLLTAAYSAATGHDRTTALALLGEAEQTVGGLVQVPGLFTVEASQAQVDVYRIGVLNALGTPDEGVKTAARLNIDLMPTPERRARAWTDTARMWHALGDSQQTFAALRSVEREAPEEVRRPALRALTSDLLYGSGRIQGLREFASRTGAVAA
ncbi:helix-turn-helix domain-containing protein [Streptomyces sp. NBC_00237]|uniref:helix-turn-helix domain-containing protein n=1 Tax=Streptomyces sp. NBC_00237 TaxID=2975687 RepID=UPI0022589A6D|nr:helix-turn-helix transcriptional regulator [Streptomyces sp. NBC_00237]MCX5206023.1 helix-turn-helix domain-containing protein [Streptomyces sp. NBC_00237]